MCVPDKEIDITFVMSCAGTRQRWECVIPFRVAPDTRFTVKEVEALHELFRKLSSSIVDDGFISKGEFQLGLFRNSKKQSLFTDRMYDLFDSNKDGVLDFGEFVRSLNIFHPDTPQAEKADFAFRLYDIWQTGFIEREEVLEMIVAFLDESDLILSDDFVKAIIDKTFEEADLNRDGKIDMEEWKSFVARNPSVLKNMTIPYLKDITTAFPSSVQKSETEDEMNKFLKVKTLHEISIEE